MSEEYDLTSTIAFHENCAASYTQADRSISIPAKILPFLASVCMMLSTSGMLTTRGMIILLIVSIVITVAAGLLVILRDSFKYDRKAAVQQFAAQWLRQLQTARLQPGGSDQVGVHQLATSQLDPWVMKLHYSGAG